MSTEQIAEGPLLPPRTEQVHAKSVALRSTVTDLEHNTRTLIRQRPIVALLAAVGVGYLVARLVWHGTREAR